MGLQTCAGLVFIIFGQLLLLCTDPSSSLDQKKLEDLVISCPPADTCVERIPADALKKRSCDCGPACARLKTCCFDSPYKDVELPKTLEECTWVQSINRNVFMVSKCDPAWDGAGRLKELCEGGIVAFGDLVSVIPVIDTLSGVSYSNIFCAMCNKEQNIIPWHLAVTRVEPPWEDNIRLCAGMFPRVLEYNDVTREEGWGYWHEYVTNRKKFIPVDVSVQVPSTLKAFISECFQDTVSECAKDWDIEEVKTKCQSYMATIEVPFEDQVDNLIGNRTYRNKHCALCNREKNLNKATCKVLGEKPMPLVTPTKYRKTLSFPYHMPDMECLWRIAGIEPKENLQNCRTVVCDPGYVIQGGQCIPKGFS